MNLMELDCHMTKDGEVVVAHDGDLERMCGEQHRGKKLAEYNFSELPPMRRKIKMHLSPGDYELKDHEDGKFSLLKDLFIQSPTSTLFSIDMKDASNDICITVNELVKEHKVETRVIWGSMFPAQHELVTKMNNNVSHFYSGPQAMKTYLLWIFGCLFCCPLKGDMLMTTHVTKRQQVRLKSMLADRG